MMQHEIKPPKGSRTKHSRVGRGDGSGRGSYSGRGMKGQKSRSGKGSLPGFEGGQLRLIKRMPHLRGFTNIFKKFYAVVNLDRLVSLKEEVIDPQVLLERGVIKNFNKPIKVLGNGRLSGRLTVSAHKFSQSAIAKIEAVGGKVVVL